MKGTNQMQSAGLIFLFIAALFSLALASLRELDPPAASSASPVEVIAEHGVGDGYPATQVPIGTVADIDVDHTGAVYFVDSVHLRVRRVDPDGTIETIFNSHKMDGPSSPRAIAIDSQRGAVYVADDTANRVWMIRQGHIEPFAGTGEYGLAGDGGLALHAQLNTPTDLSVGPDGTVYIADAFNHRVRAVTADGVIHTRVGDLPPNVDAAAAWASASLFQPELIASGDDGALYVADRRRRRLQRIVGDRSPEELKCVHGTVTGLATAANAALLVATGGALLEIRDGELAPFPAHRAAVFTSVAFRGADVIAYEWRERRLYQLGREGSRDVIGGNGTAGRFGDEGLANGASFSCHDVVATAQGEIAFTDPFNRRIAVIHADHTITTLVGPEQGLGQPLGIAADSTGLYVADAGAHRVFKVDPGGQVTPVAGSGVRAFEGDNGLATEASLDAPTDVVVTSKGAILISDSGNGRIRRVDPSGSISTVVALQDRPQLLAINNGDDLVVKTDTGTYLLSVANPGEPLVLVDHLAGETTSQSATPGFDRKGRLLWASGENLLLTDLARQGATPRPLDDIVLPASITGMTRNASGDLLLCDGLHHRLLRVTASTMDAAAQATSGV